MKRHLIAVGLVAATANAFAIWKVADGYFDDPASWNEGYVPTNTSQNAQWWYQKDEEAIVRLRDRVCCFNLFRMNLFYGYDQIVTFDGDGADFSMAAIPSGAGQRSEYYPFAIQNGNGESYNAFYVHTGGSYTKSVFRWTNVLMRVRHLKGTTEDDSETHLSFERGMSCFAGDDGTDRQTTIYVGHNAHAGRQVELVVTNGAEVVMPNLSITGGGSARTALMVTGAGSLLKTVASMKAGAAEGIKAGTNVWTVSDGGCLLAADSASGVVFGDAASPDRINELHVRGAGSVADFSRASAVTFSGETDLTVSDGAVLALPASVALAGNTAGKRGTVTVDGADSVICLTNVSGTSNLSIGSSGEGVLTLKGGTMCATDSSSTLAVELGKNAGGCGTLRVEGGTLLCRSTDPVKTPEVAVGRSGSGFLEICGGDVAVPNYVLLGVEAATVPVTNVYRQTGGHAAIDGWVSVSRPSDSSRTARVELDGGVLKTTRIMGGGSVADSSGVVSEFSADGGTLRARTSVDLSNAYPFLYGFRKAELGAKGLTVDLNGFNVHIPQHLTNKPGQTGRLIVVGSGNVYLSADGNDVSELVCAGGTTRFESNVTGWSTTAVVTNGATLSLTQATGLVLDGLVVGTARGTGVLRVAPSTRLSLGSVEFNRVALTLDGTFAANTDYPLVAVGGQVDRPSAAAWKSLTVSGNVPSGCTVQPSVSYDAVADRTTLSLRFEAGVTPSEENVWKGAAGAESADWDDPQNWSRGVPSVASIVTLSGGDSTVSSTIRVSSLNATLGALAFSAARDYLVDGNGMLYFGSTAEATISVASGNQKVAVPVATKAGLSANVSTGASLTFGEKLTVGGDWFSVNPSHTRGRVFLEGEGSSARAGIRQAGGILDLDSRAVLDGFAEGTAYEMWDSAMFRVNGEPSDSAYRLPFGFVLKAGSSFGSNWAQAEMICNDCPLVVPPYKTSLGEGGNLVKMGSAPLVFETMSGMTLKLAQCNGGSGTTDWNALPQNVFRYDGSTGKSDWTTSFGGVNVLEGELVFRGTDDVEPSPGNQAIANGHGLFVGLRTTNTVATTPGLVLDRVYADVGYEQATVVAVAENAYQSQWPAAMDDAYLIVTNGSTLAAGRLRVGGFAFATADINKRPIAPRISIDGSEMKMLEYTHFSSEPHVSAVWRVGGHGVVKTGSEPAVWNGNADVRFEDGSVLEANDAGAGITLALGAKAKGTMVFASDAVAKLAGFEAEPGSAATLAFDGGRLLLEDGTAISMPEGCALRADAGGLVMDIPEGETWTLASDVAGDGAVKVVGRGTLALSGTVSASFGGTGTISGGTLAAHAKLCPLVSDAGVASETVCLDGVSFSGRVTVDLGHDAEHPLDFDSLVGQCVVRYSGVAPDVSRLRIAGVNGGKAYARFVADNGEVKITDISDSSGLVIMVR